MSLLLQKTWVFPFLSLCNPLYWDSFFWRLLSRVSLGNVKLLFSVSSGEERPCIRISIVFTTDEYGFTRRRDVSLKHC